MRLVEKETLCRAFWQGVGTVAHPSQVGGETSCPEALQVTLALEPWPSVCSGAHRVCSGARRVPQRVSREDSPLVG